MPPWKVLVGFALTVAAFSCDNPLDAYPEQITTSFDNGKQLVLVARYSLKAQAIGILSWADVAVGTAATIDMTGPLHMHCDGSYQKVPPEYNDPGDRPELDVGEGVEGAQIHAPPGNYAVTVAVPSKHVSIKKSFSAGSSAIDPVTGVWLLPSGCVPIADTRQQLHDLTTKNVQAIGYWVGRMDASPMKSRLLALSARANDAVLLGDTPKALDALVKIRSSVDPLSGHTFVYRTYCSANVSIALLTQAVPAT